MDSISRINIILQVVSRIVSRIYKLMNVQDGESKTYGELVAEFSIVSRSCFESDIESDR